MAMCICVWVYGQIWDNLHHTLPPLPYIIAGNGGAWASYDTEEFRSIAP